MKVVVIAVIPPAAQHCCVVPSLSLFVKHYCLSAVTGAAPHGPLLNIRLSHRVLYCCPQGLST